MHAVDVSPIAVHFPEHSYSVKEIVDDLFKEKLEPDVREFCKSSLGIDRVYKSCDLWKAELNSPRYFDDSAVISDLYTDVAKATMSKSGVKPEDIGFLITVNDNPYCLDPAPTVEMACRLGFDNKLRTQNMQGMACSAFIESVRNAAGHFALNYGGNVLVTVGNHYTNWFLDSVKHTERVSMNDKKSLNDFIYFLIFSDCASACVLSKENELNSSVLRIDTSHIYSRKDTSKHGYKKATIRLIPDDRYRIAFGMHVNSKELRQFAADGSRQNVNDFKQDLPDAAIKTWDFHTAGKIFVDYVRKACGIDLGMVGSTYEVMRETGNTGAVSSVQIMMENLKKGLLRKDDLGVIVDYGWESTETFEYEILK